jgi:hypothetical protein
MALPVLAMLLGLCLAGGRKAEAAIIFSNTAATSGGNDAVAGAAAGGNGPLGQSFTTGVAGLDLKDVGLRLAAMQPADAGSLVVTLMQDDGTSPGAAVATLGIVQDLALSAAAAIYDVPIATPILLSGGTRYWIELSGTDSSAAWSWSYDLSGTGVATEYSYNDYNGAGGGAGVADSANGLYQMCVSDQVGACAAAPTNQTGNAGGTLPSLPPPPDPNAPPSPPPPPPPPPQQTLSDPQSVPEPGSVGLLLAGLGGLAGLRRRGSRVRRTPR